MGSEVNDTALQRAWSSKKHSCESSWGLDISSTTQMLGKEQIRQQSTEDATKMVQKTSSVTGKVSDEQISIQKEAHIQRN